MTNVVTGTTSMNSTPLMGVRILLPEFQANTPRKPATRTMSANCGPIETTVATVGGGLCPRAISTPLTSQMVETSCTCMASSQVRWVQQRRGRQHLEGDMPGQRLLL